MSELEDAKKRATTTYNAAADFFDHPANTFWERFGPEDWWSMIMGSGYRGTVDQLAPETREQVRQENLDFIENAGVRSVEANVVYATAIKSSD
ncbi:MAG TPA: hypothetical protein VF290_08535 [Pyrinomonadaceae bacterium]